MTSRTSDSAAGPAPIGRCGEPGDSASPRAVPGRPPLDGVSRSASSGGPRTPAGTACRADATVPAGSSPGQASVPGERPGTRESGKPGRGEPPLVTPRPGQRQDAARAWTLELPAGMPLLSLNGREHWSARHTQAQAFKQAAWVLARQAKIPALRRICVAAEYQPPDRRRRDADNPMPTVKACLDGIVAAGVIVDDECPRYVTEITCTIGETYPKGRIVLHITEVAA